MQVDAKTKVHELCERYPYMLDWLVTYNPAFKKLKNPVLYQSVARAASLEAAASLADVPLDTFLDDIRKTIAQHEIGTQEAAGAEPQLTEEDRAERQKVLKKIIHELHEGAPVEKVKARFDELVRDVDAAEVATMEQAIIAEGVPVEEVQRLCDVHVSVFKDSLEEQEEETVPEDHPVAAYRRENLAITDITAALRRRLEDLEHAMGEVSGEGQSDATSREIIADIATQLESLAQIDVHYARKENQLSPVLEQHGVEGPTKVMWGIHDDIRSRVKVDRAHASRNDAAGLAASLPDTLQMIDDMIYKEEKILFPTSLKVITEEEWEQIAAGDPDIGYAWIEGPSGARGQEAAATWAPGAGRSLNPSIPDVRVTGGYLLPLLLGDHLQRGGKQDLLLLIYHVIYHLQGVRQGGGQAGCVVAGGVGPVHLYAGADIIVDAPHDLGRPFHPVLLETGGKLVLLAGIVHVNLGQALQLSGDIGDDFPAGSVTLPFAGDFSHCVLQVFQTAPERTRDISNSQVLPAIGGHRVVLGHRFFFLLFQGVLEDADVHVTETLDLLYRYPFGDDGLLHGCHFCSIHITDQLVEPGLNLLHRRSLVELVDDLLEYLLVFRPSLLCYLWLCTRHFLGPDLMLGNGLSDVVQEGVQGDVGQGGGRFQARRAGHTLVEDGVFQLLEGRIVGHQPIQHVRVALT